MELSEILNSLSSGTEKTASDRATTGSGSSSLSSAIDRALGSTTEKVASHTSSEPAGDLMKIASDLANAEQEALVKEAHIYGAAVADGFIHRMNSYESASPLTKTASYGDQASPELIKQAMELGYRNTMASLQGVGLATKTASFDKVAEMQKVAAFNKGQQDAVKVASYMKGQQDAQKIASDLIKLAGNYEVLGFKVGNNILARLAG